MRKKTGKSEKDQLISKEKKLTCLQEKTQNLLEKNNKFMRTKWFFFLEIISQFTRRNVKFSRKNDKPSWAAGEENAHVRTKSWCEYYILLNLEINVPKLSCKHM